MADDLLKPKTCGVDGCEGYVPEVHWTQPNTILCQDHWDALPDRYRDEVFSTRERMRQGNARWRRIKQQSWLLACSNAIKAAGRTPEDVADVQLPCDVED